MYTEESAIDIITVLENGTIQVRRVTRVLKDGVEISQSYHRHTLTKGADLSLEDAKVVSVATAAWQDE